MEPNILIINRCNQNCSFCFAKIEMKRPLRTEFMSFNKFKSVLDRLPPHLPLESIKIMGGEPTLHPKFMRIIQFSLLKYQSVQLFTNGIFSPSVANFLRDKGKKISLIFNVSTPGFQEDANVRKTILSNIDSLIKSCHVILSFTYDNKSLNILDRVPTSTLKEVESVRLGISNPQRQFSLTTYKKLGRLTFEYIKKIRSVDRKKPVLLNCGYTPCMFDTRQMNYLTKNHILQQKKWGCAGKDSSYDIGIDGKAFSCFVYSTNKAAIDTHTDKRLFLAKYLSKQRTVPQICKKCIFFMNICPGPCIC